MMTAAAVESRQVHKRIEYVVKASTTEDVTTVIARLMRDYHPLGYGTTFGPIVKGEDDDGEPCFVARGWRYSSAD